MNNYQKPNDILLILLAKMKTKFLICPLQILPIKHFHPQPQYLEQFKKCGFKGIAELRYLISKEDKDKSKNVSPYAINKLLDKVYQESTQTIENIPIPAILKAIDHINNAEKIFIYARGFTAMFAEHFQMYLQLMGYNAVVVKDVKWMEQTKI